jgi:hypothetical protein
MTTQVPVPEWLAAWRERKGVSAPEPPAPALCTTEQHGSTRTERT